MLTSNHYTHVPIYSQLVKDYYKGLLGSDYVGHPPYITSFRPQISAKQVSFAQRDLLAQVLKRQAKDTKNTHKASLQHIELLSQANTFTVTTGHQLNLFTGPLFFWYKIITTLNLAKQLKMHYPEYHFVPVYWMATEDHDFAEVNHFYFKGHRLQWQNTTNDQFVGRLATNGLSEVLRAFKAHLGISHTALELTNLFEAAYLGHDTFAKATRYIVNHFFGSQGLVVIDGDDAALKQLAIPLFREELTQKRSYGLISKQAEKLQQNGYHVQQAPSEVNLFYAHEGRRLKLIPNGSSEFLLGASGVALSGDVLLRHLVDHPERFSPNALLRPVYQELVLPNLAYLGGGKELDYWLELKPLFEAIAIPFPILMLRNSAFLLDRATQRALDGFGLAPMDVMGDVHPFINQSIRANMEVPAINSLHESIAQNLQQLSHEYKDAHVLHAIEQKAKELKGRLAQLERKLIAHEKKGSLSMVHQVFNLKEGLYPQGVMQERRVNFSEYYLEYGDKWLPLLQAHLDPFKTEVLHIGLNV